MKKFIIGTVAIAMCFCLTACGASNSEASITNLGNQLDETSNKISCVTLANPNDINVDTTKLQSSTDAEDLSNNISNTQQTLLNEQYYKMEILNKTVKLKNCLNQNLKLSKAQTTAIKDLTSSLSKYTNSIEYSQSEMESAVKSISSMKKNTDKNSAKISAKLNRLACNSNARSAYYENILSILDELEVYFNCDQDTTQPETPEPANDNINDTNNTQSTNKIETTNNTQESNQANEKKKTSIKNIDTYLGTTDTNEENTENSNGNCPECDKQNQTNKNISNNYTNNPNYPNSYYNLNNPISGNNIYNRYNRFNPNRNTDTYGPTTKNIDTYGGYSYGYNGYNGFGYNNTFNNFNRANGGYYGYGYNNGFNNGFYGNPYGNPVNNGYYAPINNGSYAYNSNNYNRLTSPLGAYASTEQEILPEQRLEDYEKVGQDNTVEKIDKEQFDNEETLKNDEASTNKLKNHVQDLDGKKELDLRKNEEPSKNIENKKIFNEIEKSPTNQISNNIPNTQKDRKTQIVDENDNTEIVSTSNLPARTAEIRIVNARKTPVKDDDVKIIAH